MAIYLRMRGGLGNQMYQYAYAYAILKRFPRLQYLVLDVREYKTYHVRSFELSAFALPEPVKTIDSGSLKYDSKIRFFRYCQKVYQVLFRKEISKISKRQLKRGFVFGTRYSDAPNEVYTDNIYLYGYFQDHACFDDYRSELKSMFYDSSVAEAMVYKFIKEKSVAISIRIGEDVQRLKWKIFSRDYYIRGVKAIKRIHPIDQLVVYSDNIKYIKENHWFDELGIETIYVEGLSSTQQISLMQRSHDFIISNSTFSWWGAYLGYKEDSIIIAPEYWQPNLKTKDIRIELPLFRYISEE